MLPRLPRGFRWLSLRGGERLVDHVGSVILHSDYGLWVCTRASWARDRLVRIDPDMIKNAFRSAQIAGLRGWCDLRIVRGTIGMTVEVIPADRPVFMGSNYDPNERWARSLDTGRRIALEPYDVIGTDGRIVLDGIEMRLSLD